MSFTKRTVSVLPFSDTGETPVDGQFSTLAYIKGPPVLIVIFADDLGGEYSFPMTPGDQYVLPPGRVAKTGFSVKGLEATGSSADFMFGTGRYTTAKGEGGVAAPRRINFSLTSFSAVGTYSGIGFNNPDDSGYILEVTQIILFPQSTDTISLAYIDNDADSQSPYFDTTATASIRLNPYAEGTAAVERISMQDTIQPENQALVHGDGQTLIWDSMGGFQETLSFDMSDKPIILPPASMLIAYCDTTGVAIRALFVGEEKKA